MGDHIYSRNGIASPQMTGDSLRPNYTRPVTLNWEYTSQDHIERLVYARASGWSRNRVPILGFPESRVNSHIASSPQAAL